MIIRNNIFNSVENVYCEPSSELSRQDGSDEGSQHGLIEK